MTIHTKFHIYVQILKQPVVVVKESARGSLDTMDAIKIDHEHGEKAESFGGSGIPKAFSHVGWWWVTFSLGIHPRWIKSLLISREAHSPIPEPSSFRLLGSPLYPVYLSSNVSRLSHSRSAIAAFASSVCSSFSLNFLRCFLRRSRN